MKKNTVQKTGRPFKGQTETIIFKVTDSEKELLITYSEKLQLNKSEIIRQALNEFISRRSESGFTLPLFNK